MNKVVINSCFGGFSLSKEAMQYLVDKYGVESFKYGYVNLKRHDKRLIEVVELLGDKANGMCAKLTIKEIPSNLYRIDKYDGYESIKTPDTVDWIVIGE